VCSAGLGILLKLKLRLGERSEAMMSQTKIEKTQGCLLPLHKEASPRLSTNDKITVMVA